MNHRCNDFRERLGAYLDGELEESSAREIERHLEDCPACRSALREMRLTDRLLREGLKREEIGAERSAASLTDTLERIRQEPSPAWEPQQPKRRTGWILRWNWRLRWVVGVAAATAAVILALRISPEPIAPERPESTPEEQTDETVPKKEPPIPYTTASTADEAEAVALTDEAAIEEAVSGPEPIAKGVLLGEGESAPQELQGEPIFVAPVTKTRAEQTADLESPEPERHELKIRGGRGEPLQTDAPPEPVPAAGKKREHFLESIPEKVVTQGAVPQSRGVFYSGTASEAPSWEISYSDTLGPTTELHLRLEEAALRLQAARPSELPRAEHARRWRTIGDLWEWIGRQEASPAAFAKAVDAYRMAVEIDSQAASLDSTRVQRARHRSAGEIEGNIRAIQR